jgi:glutamyl/glutaminyl-tRNA synthetase
MNKEYLSSQSTEFLENYLQEALGEGVKILPQYAPDRISKLAPVVFERVHNKVEIHEALVAGEYQWVFDKPEYDPAMLRWKKDDNEAASLPRLQQAIRLLKSADFTTPDKVKAALWDYVEEVGRGELLWPLRVSLTGLERSPDPFTVAYIIGREETLSRIKTACDKIGE